MIDVEHLTKYYGQRAAVRDVSFHVGKGEILGLLGPNGAGKTTTMRILTGYLPATSGKAVVAGFDVAENPMEVRRRLGYLPETVPLYTDMTVQAYLDFTAKLRGVPGKGRKRRVEEVMDLCRISDVRNKVIAKLSRGYRQRVGLAQAIVHNPQVIILDEPTVGLDPRQIIEIRQVIRDLAGGHSLILSTHILPEVSTLCDRVVIINRGKVLVEDTLANLEQQGAENERLRLEVRGPATQVQDYLQTLPNVTRVDLVSADSEEAGADMLASESRDLNRFMLEAAPGTDLREEISSAIFGQGWGLLEMRTAVPSLEEIFVRLVSTDEAAELEEEEQEGEISSPDDELDELESGEVEGEGEEASADGSKFQGLTLKVADVNDELEALKDKDIADDKAEEIAEAPVMASSDEEAEAEKVVTTTKVAPAFLQQDDDELDEPAPAPVQARSSKPNYNKTINQKKKRR